MKKTVGMAAALAAGALALPAGAQAHVKTGVSAVKQHTTAADAALDRAVALYDRNAVKRGDRLFAQSRHEMAAANREASKLRRQADTPTEEAAGARATALVAAEQDENIEKLTAALDGAKGRAERKVAQAALADTRGREKALVVLTALLDEVPEQARAGIAQAIADRSQDRDSEIEAQAEALVDGDVSSRSKQLVGRSVEANVEGQATGAVRLAGLIAGDDLPEQAKIGLQAAYDAVAAEHGSVADILARFSDRMPAKVRASVEKVVTQARQNAQSMRDDRPASPAGQPETSPAAPETISAGQPESTPAAHPQAAPTAQPDATPTGQS